MNQETRAGTPLAWTSLAPATLVRRLAELAGLAGLAGLGAASAWAMPIKTLSPEVVSVPLAGGAHLQTRLAPRVVRNLDKVLASRTDLRPLEPAMASFQVFEEHGELKLDGLRKGWAITDTSIEHIEMDLSVNLADLARRKLKGSGRATILDWGCGDASALRQLADRVKGLPVDLVGVADIPFAHWWKAPENVTFILDKAQRLDRYLDPGSVSVIYSHMGLEHLHGDELKDHLDFLGRLLTPDGEMRLGQFMIYEFPKSLKARRPKGFGEGWILRRAK